ncbi:hypothetical protein TSAR_002392 [Trichomalopsis sarcophagae]|uniref:Uncharacterized protein n=1 Tax=Trichomalopsis sarcophagae TaxID=543379 RepID=A0A232F6J3_9HYME|nr:hypothetical protein TSAR_002392 [Trichomalopsis sarcophagae]
MRSNLRTRTLQPQQISFFLPHFIRAQQPLLAQAPRHASAASLPGRAPSSGNSSSFLGKSALVTGGRVAVAVPFYHHTRLDVPPSGAPRQVSIFSVEGCHLHTEIRQTYTDSRHIVVKT